jgi:hypothetical protein
LLQILQSLLPDERLMSFVRTVLDDAALPGLRQGGCVSPLFENLYLDHFFDRPWRKRCPETPFVRVADDILLLCNSKQQALQVHEALRQLLLPAGMSLKQTATSATTVLSTADSADWIGFRIIAGAHRLEFFIGDRAWERLSEQLARTHLAADAPLRANDIVRGWIGQMGPCYSREDRPETYRRIHDTARELAFEEIPGVPELRSLWQASNARWSKCREQIKAERLL